MKLGKEYWSTDSGHKYEVSKITTGYVYLTRYDGSCSHVRYISKDKWKDQIEFVETSRSAWEILLNNDVVNADRELQSKKRLLASFLKENA